MKSRVVTVWSAALLLLAACSSTPRVNAPAAAPTISKTSDADRRRQAAELNVQMGIGYLREGNLAIAKEKLDRAREEDSDAKDIHGATALLDERLGDEKGADKEYREQLKATPNDPSQLNNYAVFLCSHGHTDEGVRYFEKAATNPLYQTPWAAYTNAGVCLRAGHRDSDAAVRFSRALQSNPNYAEAVFQASDLDWTLHQYTNARLRIDLYMRNTGATPDLLLLGWRIAQSQNDAAGQQRYAARLTQEFPNSDQARAVAQTPNNPG